MASIDAIEDAFLRGEWVAALEQSKEQLAHSIVQIRQRAQDAEKTSMSTDEERLLSVYLQAVFELEKYDEVETASVVVQSLEPLSFDVAIQWIKFLIAMDRSDAAVERINTMLARYQALLGEAHTDGSLLAREYKRIFDVLVFQILLPSESIDSVRRSIYSDDILDEVSKQHLLERVDGVVEELARATAASTQSASARTAQAQSPQSTTVSQASASASASRNAASKLGEQQKQEEDESSTYIKIGGAALALTFAALGAIRYKDRVHDAVEGVVPAISKGLSDAKYALFDA